MAASRPGSLDVSFQPVITGPVRAILVQPDSRIVIGGTFREVGGILRSGIARLLSDGSADPAFDPGPGISGADRNVSAIKRQPDGKILIGGHFTAVSGVNQPFLARLIGDDPAARAPVIVTQLSNQRAYYKYGAQFRVAADGPDLQYQWQFNGVNIPGATNAAYLISGIGTNHFGTYRVVVSNSLGVATSEPASLILLDLAEALDTPGWIWTTGGYSTHPLVTGTTPIPQRWIGETNVTSDGEDAAAVETTPAPSQYAAGPPSYTTHVWIETTVTGPGLLSFESNIFSCYVNGNRTNFPGYSLSRVVEIPAGPAVVRWDAPTTSSITYLDRVRFTPTGPRLTVLRQPGPFQFSAPVSPGQLYRFESSTNLKDWLPFATVMVTNSVVVNPDSNSDKSPHRFFRAVPLG
jgi:hypothetical protein